MLRGKDTLTLKVNVTKEGTIGYAPAIEESTPIDNQSFGVLAKQSHRHTKYCNASQTICGDFYR